MKLRQHVNTDKSISDIFIGNNCRILDGCNIGKSVVIGNNVRIQSNVVIGDGCFISDDVRIGDNSKITAQFIGPGVKIGENCRISEEVVIESNSTILQNVAIGYRSSFGKQCFVEGDCDIGRYNRFNSLCHIVRNSNIRSNMSISGQGDFPWSAWIDCKRVHFRYGCRQNMLDRWDDDFCNRLSDFHGRTHDQDRNLALEIVRLWSKHQLKMSEND